MKIVHSTFKKYEVNEGFSVSSGFSAYRVDFSNALNNFFGGFILL
jgi:hypothetical protein